MFEWLEGRYSSMIPIDDIYLRNALRPTQALDNIHQHHMGETTISPSDLE